MIYVYRDGKIVEKTTRGPVKGYRFTDYESPVDGALITSPRQRERDLNRNDAFDPRDLRKDHHWRRGRDVQRAEVDAGRSESGSGGQRDFWR